MEKINLQNKLELFSDHWNPRVIAEHNNQHVKLAKLKGEFVWHHHDHEDELFFVLSGELKIEFRDKTVTLTEQECIVIPKDVEHRPIADKEVSVMLFEPKSTVNTGNTEHEYTRDKLQWI